MEITVKMPDCVAPQLLDVRVSEGIRVETGDILFSYSSDGALLFEYAACSGTVTEIFAVCGRVRCGESVLKIAAEIPAEELFPQSYMR